MTPALAACALLVQGCERDQVKVYKVAKEQPQQPAGAAHDHNHDRSASAPLPRLTWKAPNNNWEEVPPGEMRLASFRVKGGDGKVADLGVFPLPGMAGSDLSNVNRWRGQVGLEGVEEGELEKIAEKLDVAGSPGSLYDMAGENPGSGDKTRILAAILRKDNIAWFFKMTGDDALVASQKQAFKDFLTSAKFEQAAQLPPDHPPIGGAAASEAASMASAPPAGATPNTPEWQVPPGWQPAAAGQFLAAKFAIPGAGQTAVNVSMSMGEGGGVEGNVNRWRKQLGLPDAQGQDLGAASFDAGGHKASVVDISGADGRTGQKAHIVGVVVPLKDRTWFYKLMGEDSVVQREKDAFLKFVQSAKYPNAP